MKHYKIKKSITNRNSISISAYLKDIRSYDSLTADQEAELFKEIKLGNQLAKDKLIKANLRFVISIAKQYQNKGLDLEDLIQYGNLGLLYAINKFDSSKGYKFISYAVWWIRQAILRAINGQSKLIQLPTSQSVLYHRILSFSEAFEQQYERPPTDDEISTSLHIPISIIVENRINKFNVMSLDEHVGADSDEVLSDYIPSTDNKDDKSDLENDVQIILQELIPIEKDIITSLFGINCESKSIEQLAMQYNLTKERVRQIKDKAILKLRKLPNINLLAKYL